MYDCTNQRTIDNVREWMSGIEKVCMYYNYMYAMVNSSNEYMKFLIV